MRVYLAARYSRIAELNGYADELRRRGHDITARWLQGGHQLTAGELSDEAAHEKRTQFAEEDYADLLAAECVISFSETPRQPSTSRGGRHVEFGIALEAKKRCILIGPRENVFHCIPWVEWYPTWADYLAADDAAQRARERLLS